MSDIFISYASGERVRAQRLATSLENEGWSVFWDQYIPSGRIFHKVIKKELSEARCVLTLWCGASINSRAERPLAH